MAIKKPSGDKSRSYSRGAKQGATKTTEGIAATFRPEVEKRETQKTTIDFDKDLYRALKLHSVMTGRSVRDLVHDCVRSGLAEAGVDVDAIPGAGSASIDDQ